LDVSHANKYLHVKCIGVQQLLLLHPFNGRHQTGKPFWILLEQEMMGWQWHQLYHMQIICTSFQTDNHASISPLSFFTGRMHFLPPNQQRQSTEGNQSAKLFEIITYVLH